MICVNEIQQIGGSIEYGNTGDLIEDAKLIIDSAQRSAHQAVNVALVVRNWLLGRRIAEEELGDGSTRLTFDGGFIIPLQGTGLWGPIWGYLALDDEKTIVGAVFDHKGETPGLGGEIATDKFAQRFVGKSLQRPIVLKKNADKASPYEVDAISGGTMTSNGVTEMLAKAYDKYGRSAAASEAADENEERKEADE